MAQTFLRMAAVLGFLGVACGAFGAHALRTRLSPDLLATFQTGVLYHLIHALALLGTAWVVSTFPSKLAHAAGWLFVAGVVLFSGSLYLLALSGVRSLGAITPFGGLAFLAGWACLFGARLS
jgi:uncharacterized membrane protein YgdD (TMEM256/DUF423 family)